ncbi:BRCT domain-containing protein [Artemisia annua]|uniref:RNA polymerase II C-terminal domain phosphatase-like n=1 Tax=Artemisia annua TaxID=35608 RepID=A0A2U1NMA1_ARTAN|nr:BRCT domain-containing protein [Artemisia annua]
MEFHNGENKISCSKKYNWLFKMSVVDVAPLNSSNSDDFAAFLDTELESTPNTSPEPEEDADETHHSDINRTKRQKIEVMESDSAANESTSQHETTLAVDASVKKNICTHPSGMLGLCTKCGEKWDNQSGVRLEYIHKDVWVSDDEAARIRERDLKNLLRHKKLYLVLDLDHTLLNSTHFIDGDATQEEGYLMNPSDPMQDPLRGSLFKLNSMQMMTKLRPFVHTFLKEANKLFEMYIYTMGERAYALEMANLLDPGKVYFESRVITRSDCTREHKKDLDVVLGQESAVLILDDTEEVWDKRKENLILMERYHFFASSLKQFKHRCKSLSELKSDESEADGTLATVLQVLKKIHTMFFDPDLGENFSGQDVRQILGTVRSQILKGCKIVFSHIFPIDFKAENHKLWKMAERLGATCAKEVDPSVTHVISTDVATAKSRWAVHQKKFLVEPRWLEAANYLWQRQPEDRFPVNKI